MQNYKIKDPGWIVQDEVSGMLLTGLLTPALPGISPITYLLITFISFRFFDIIKFFPANYYDRSDRPSAIMHDDLISSFYAAGLSFFIFKIFFQ
jgi:phosphatidylglycerophosphatase A